MSFSLAPAPHLDPLPPAHLPQRRHTTAPALPTRRLSRPFVSSPLAGPVVSSDGTTTSAPTRTASAPDLAPALRPAHPRRPRPATISGRSELARLAAEEERRAETRARRASAHGTPGPAPRPREREPMPPVPPLPTTVPRPRRPSTSPAAALSRAPAAAAAEHWLTSTPPPRFSRHSIALAGVVMPVRADAARRRSASSASDGASVCSSGSVGSAASTTTAATSPCESLKEKEVESSEGEGAAERGKRGRFGGVVRAWRRVVRVVQRVG